MTQQVNDVVPLAEARHFLPRPPHPGTIVRWALRGVGRDRVKLETVKIGGRRYTDRASVERFIAALSRTAGGPAAASRTRAEQRRRAEEALDADGVN